MKQKKTINTGKMLPKPTAEETRAFRQAVKKQVGKEWEFVAYF